VLLPALIVSLTLVFLLDEGMSDRALSPCSGNFWWTADMRSVGRRPCWSAALDFALLPLPLYLALLLVEAATLFSLVGYSTPAWASQCAPARGSAEHISGQRGPDATAWWSVTSERAVALSSQSSALHPPE